MINDHEAPTNPFLMTEKQEGTGFQQRITHSFWIAIPYLINRTKMIQIELTKYKKEIPNALEPRRELKKCVLNSIH